MALIWLNGGMMLLLEPPLHWESLARRLLSLGDNPTWVYMMNLPKLLLKLRLVPSVLSINLILPIFIMSSSLLNYTRPNKLNSRLNFSGLKLGISFPKSYFISFILLNRKPNSNPYRWMELELLLFLRLLQLSIPIIPLLLFPNPTPWKERNT